MISLKRSSATSLSWWWGRGWHNNEGWRLGFMVALSGWLQGAVSSLKTFLVKDSGGYQTCGFIVTYLGCIPTSGDHFEWQGLQNRGGWYGCTQDWQGSCDSYCSAAPSSGNDSAKASSGDGNGSSSASWVDLFQKAVLVTIYFYGNIQYFIQHQMIFLIMRRYFMAFLNNSLLEITEADIFHIRNLLMSKFMSTWYSFIGEKRQYIHCQLQCTWIMKIFCQNSLAVPEILSLDPMPVLRVFPLLQCFQGYLLFSMWPAHETSQSPGMGFFGKGSFLDKKSAFWIDYP